MKSVSLLLVLLLLPVSFVGARELSLDQAEQLGRDYSLALKRARLQHESAASQRDAAKAGRYPTVSVDARANYIDNLPSFTIELPVGEPMHREIGSKENYQADFMLNLPLYTGGRLSSNISAGESLVRVQQALSEATLGQVTYQIRAAYLSVVRAERLIATGEASLARANLINDDTHAMAEAGAADSVALLETQLGVTEASISLKEYKSIRHQAAINLLVLLGLDPNETLTLTTSMPEPIPPPTNVGEVSRPELEAASAKVSQSEALVRGQKGGYLPSLSLFGGYSVGKPNRDMFNADWDDYFTAGVRANWSFNLGNQIGKQVEAAQFSLAMARNEEQSVRDNLDREASLALAKLSLSYEQYSAAQERAQIASTNYRLANSQHRAGALPTNRLLEIERNLSRAEAARAAAAADYQVARAGYNYAIGEDTF